MKPNGLLLLVGLTCWTALGVGLSQERLELDWQGTTSPYAELSGAKWLGRTPTRQSRDIPTTFPTSETIRLTS